MIRTLFSLFLRNTLRILCNSTLPQNPETFLENYHLLIRISTPYRIRMNLGLQINLGSWKEVHLALTLWKLQTIWIITQWLSNRKRTAPWLTSEMWMHLSQTDEASNSSISRWLFLRAPISIWMASMRWLYLLLRERNLQGQLPRKRRSQNRKRTRRVSRQISKWVDSMVLIIQEKVKWCLITNII